MRTTSKAAYRALTMPQRFRAAVAAKARDDGEEFQRLKDTNPDGNYVINTLSACFNDLATAAFVIRIDLMTAYSHWLTALAYAEENDPDSELRNAVIDQSLRECASIITARNQWLDELGLSVSDFEATDGPQNPHLDKFIHRSRGRECPEEVKSYFVPLRDWFAMRHGLSGPCN